MLPGPDAVLPFVSLQAGGPGGDPENPQQIHTIDMRKHFVPHLRDAKVG